MGCSDIVIEGNSNQHQYAFVLTSDIASLAGVQFGIEYDAGVQVLGWTLCTGGLSIPEEGWPASGTALAVTWDEPQYPSSPDKLVLVGYLTVGPGSSGTISVSPDARIGEAQFADAPGDLFALDPAALGVVDTDGGGAGYNPCGAIVGTDGPGDWPEEDGPISDGFPEEETCSDGELLPSVEINTLWTHRYPGGDPQTDHRDFALAVEFIEPFWIGVLGIEEHDRPNSKSRYVFLTYELNGGFYSATPLWTRGSQFPVGQPGLLAVDGESFAYVAGVVDDPAIDTRTAKLDAGGNEHWRKQHSRDGSAIPVAVVARGDYVYTVSTYTQPDTEVDVLVEKRLVTNGNEVWVREAELPPATGDRIVKAAVVDADGNTYVGGTQGFVGSEEAYVVKLDDAGDQMWMVPINELWSNKMTGLALGPDGYIYAAGFGENLATDNDDAWFIKLDRDTGQQLLPNTTYDAYLFDLEDPSDDCFGPGDERVYDLAVTGDGYLYLVGHRGSLQYVGGQLRYVEREMYIRLRTDTGEPDLTSAYRWPCVGCQTSGAELTTANLEACHADGLGGVVAAGSWRNPLCVEQPSQVMHARRLSPTYQAPGEIRWVGQADGPEDLDLDDGAVDVAFQAFGSEVEDYYYCEVGYTWLEDEPVNWDSDIFVAMYSLGAHPLGVGSSTPDARDPSVALTVRSGSELILFHPTLGGSAQVKAYDVTGRLVRATHVEGDQTETVISGLSPGVYFLELETPSTSAKGRGVVVR